MIFVYFKNDLKLNLLVIFISRFEHKNISREKKMSSRDDIRRGLGSNAKKNTQVIRVDPLAPQSSKNADTRLPTLVLPNAEKICSIVLFFIGSFAIGFGSGFGTGYATKECV